MGIPIDVAALLADEEFETIAPGYAYSGLSNAGAVAISIRLSGVRSPVSITVEGSSDEVAWSELGSLSDLVAGDDLLIDSPPDRIRVTYEGEAGALELRLRPFHSGGNGGSLPDEWSVDQYGNLVITPDPSIPAPVENETTPPIKIVSPGTHAICGNADFAARALALGVAGNAFTVESVSGGSSVEVAVVGTTITLTWPGGTTNQELVDAANADPAASAIAVFDTPTPGGLVSQPGSFPFEGGYAPGAYVAFRLGQFPGWYIHADAGIDVETTDGQFVAQFYKGGNDVRAAQPGGRCLTLFDNDWNEKLAVDADGVGFNGQATSRPVIAAVPDAQAVVDALVALGLVTQAP